MLPKSRTRLATPLLAVMLAAGVAAAHAVAGRGDQPLQTHATGPVRHTLQTHAAAPVAHPLQTHA